MSSLRFVYRNKMPQTSISTFFQRTTAIKRKQDEIHVNLSTPKRQSTDQTYNDTSQEADLTLQQQERMKENKLNAKIRLRAKSLPALSSNIGPSWYTALEKHFEMDYFQTLSTFIETERQNHTVYPPEDLVYSWTQMCDIQKVKVVILGQDPYHGPGQAHGLAFSVVKGVAIPPSLLNMYKELTNDIPGFTAPKHGDLTGWAKQGVLLLNACLTVRANQANSHKDRGWEKLTDGVIKYLSDNCNGVAFLLWGNYAQKKGAAINKKKHLTLQCAHPSPLSASRGFLGSHHFSKANDYLKVNCKDPIDWNSLP